MNSLFLSNYTTFRLGGPCRRLLSCETPEELQLAVRSMDGIEPFLLIGGGSNLLVADEGFDQTVIRYYSSTSRIQREGDELIVTGSTLLDDLAAFAVEQGLEGLVCCTGIPGTVGGAIAGNAGAFGEQIGDCVVSAIVMDTSGSARTVQTSDFCFGYRCSALQKSGDILVEARLKLQSGSMDRLQAHRHEILALRASKHPDWRKTPTAGSFFKNIEPTSKAERRQAAGWFLEQVGAKDMRVGGARVYEKHANIIVADGGCTAKDVLGLSQRMAKAVFEKFGLVLEPEVRFLR